MTEEQSKIVDELLAGTSIEELVRTYGIDAFNAAVDEHENRL